MFLMANRFTLLIVVLVQASGIITSARSDFAEHYDLRLHYRPLQLDLVKHADHAEAILDKVQSKLNEKLSSVIGKNGIDVNVYNFSVSGRELQLPTLIVHVELSLSESIGREEIVRRLSSQRGEDDRILVPYIRPIESPTKFRLTKLSPNLAAAFQPKDRVEKCFNGGVLLPNATCACQSYFGGPDCSELICEHQGVLVESSSRCFCAPGWIGRHCETLPILPSSLNSFDFSSRTLVVVLNNEISTSFDIVQTLQALTDYFGSANEERQNFYKNFVLSTFVRSGEAHIENTIETTNYQDLIAQIANVNPLDGDDTQPILTATKTAIVKLSSTLPKSTVFVVTDHLASDGSPERTSETIQTAENDLIKNALYWQHSISLILTQRAGEERPANPGDPYQSLKRVASRSNGELADLGSSKKNVAPAVKAILQAQFKAETIAIQRDADFSSKSLAFQLVTSKPSSLYVSGQGFQLKAIQGGAETEIQPIENAETFALYSLSSDQTNLKLVGAGVQSSPTISYRAVVQTDRDLFVAYTNNPLADATANYPTAGIPNFVVVNEASDVPTAKVSGVSGSNSNQAVFDERELEARAPDSNFKYIAKTPVQCPEGPFLTKVRFQTQNEQILMPSFCFDPDHHRDEHENSCNGHGTYDPEEKKCVCNKYFDGPNCEDVLCENGGKVNEFPGNGSPLCLCDKGFQGEHCELLSCEELAERPDFSTRSFSVVLQRSYSQAFLNTEIRDAVKSALNSIFEVNEGQEYFGNLTLTTFVKALARGEDAEVQIQSFEKSADLIVALNAANIKYAISTETQQSSLEALLETLQSGPEDGGEDRLVLLFLDAPPKNPSLADEIKTLALKKSTALHIFVTAPYGLDGSGECMDAQSIEIYKDLSRATSGLFFNLCKTYSIGSVKGFLTGFVRSSYEFQAVRKQTSADCNLDVEIKIADGTDLRYFLLDADKSATFDLKLESAGGKSVDVIEIGKLDTATLYQASGLEQTDYKLTITASEPTTCRLTIGQESDFYVSVGFTANPSVDASNSTIMFGYPLYPVVYLSTQFQSTAKIELTVDDEGKYRQTGVIRENCTFDYFYLRELSCSVNGGPFSVQLIITTEDGVYAERASSVYCDKLDVQCLNDGEYDGSECKCGPSYNGDYCEKPICENGIEAENQCQCYEGYSGNFCENMLCTSWNFLDIFDTNIFEFSTVVFAVQNDQNFQSTIQQILSSIQPFIDELERTKFQMKHYSLITFSDKSMENVINTVDTNEFVAKLTEQLNNPVQAKGKKVQALQSMALAAEVSVYKPAIVYLFANADTVIADAKSIMESLSLGGVEINVFHTKPGGITGGSSQYYRSSTTNSNGRYVWVAPENVGQLLSSYLPTTVFENSQFLDEFRDDCTSGVEFEFSIETRVNWFTVLVRGIDANQYAKVTDEAGIELTPKIHVSDQGSYIATFDRSFSGGRKKLSVKTTKGECGIQVRGSSGLHTEVGFTLDMHSDYPNERPTIVSASNGSTYVTVKVGRSFVSLVEVVPEHIQLFMRDPRTGSDQLLVESDLYGRDQERCAHQYISSLLEVPTNPYKQDQTPLIVKITGTEDGNENFQRVKLYFPEPIECKNGDKNNEFGYCECPAIYSGDDCSIPNCKNGGIVDLTVCSCKSGFYGETCELAVV